MVKIVIFDLDSTLAPIGMPVGEEELTLLRKIEETGVRIAICSGKTCDYLCGFMRQIGIKNPILIGENGAVIRIGVDLPPKWHYRVPVSSQATASLKSIRSLLVERYPHIWFQPNKIGVTPFPTTEQEFEEIAALLETCREDMKGVEVYRHVDSFDIVPSGIDKGVGISYLLDHMKLSKEDIIAVGDGVNDYAMFDLAAYSIGVRVKEEERVNKNCESTLDMLQYLLRYLKNNSRKNKMF